MTIRPELSKRNPYSLPADRFYELQHYCYQYDTWVDEYRTGTAPAAARIDGEPHGSGDGNPTARLGSRKAELKSKIELVEKTVVEAAGPVIAPFLLIGVTKKHIGYKYLRNTKKIPCGKNYYYKSYRKFFWLLDQKKQ